MKASVSVVDKTRVIEIVFTEQDLKELRRADLISRDIRIHDEVGGNLCISMRVSHPPTPDRAELRERTGAG